MLNFFITNVVLGVALGFSILRHVPNTFKGVQLPSLAAKIKVSKKNILIHVSRKIKFILRFFKFT